MQHHSGFYFCTKSNWDGNFFTVKNLVSIEQYDKDDLINNRIDFLNPESYTEDFKKVINVKSLFPDDKFNSWRSYYELKPEVFTWLEENVEKQKNGNNSWCCGNKDYNSEISVMDYFSIFFCRKKDAIKFIKTWSMYGKPTLTYNQNTHVKKVLNKTTNKLEIYEKTRI